MNELGTIERAYADGYAAARAEIERLRARNAELLAALRLADGAIEGHFDDSCSDCRRYQSVIRAAIAKAEGKE